jgi:hypothetical protein
MATVPVVVIVIDQVAVTTPDATDKYAKVTAIRIQDVARHAWYSWDDPTRAFNAMPIVTAGTQNLYVAFWAVNMKPTPQDLVLTLNRMVDGEILADKTFNVPAGQGLGIEYTGNMTTAEALLSVRAEYAAGPPPAKPPEPAPVLPVVEIPDLPWYAAWLRPLIEYLANFGGAVINYVVQTLRVGDAFNAIINFPQKLIDTLTGNAGKALKDVGAASVVHATNTIADVKSGSSDWMKPFEDALHGIGENLAKDAYIGDYTNKMKNEALSGGEAVLKLNEYAEKVRTAVLDADIINAATSAASLGQYNFISPIINDVIELLGVKEISVKAYMAPFERLVVQPSEYQFNAWFPTKQPDLGSLMDMASKRIVEHDYFLLQCNMLGFNNFWAEKLWKTASQVPGLGDIITAYYREGWTDEKLAEILAKTNIDPTWFGEVWTKIKDLIPPYPDLINMRVKEVISQKDFEKFLLQARYKKEWATRLWDAHFAPATWMDFLTAWRRKETVSIPHAEGAATIHKFGDDLARDVAVLQELSVLVDYDPRYWDFFKTRMYNDPSPRMSMWAYETGTVTEPQLRSVVHRYGYTPDTEQWFGDMLVHFQERPWITRYLTALQAEYIDGVIDAAELEKRVLAIPRNKEVAKWITKIADVRKEMLAAKPGAEKQQLLNAADLRKMYVLDIIDTDKLRAELLLRGYQLMDIEILIELIKEEKQATMEGGMKKGLTISELFDAMRYEFKTEDEVRTELQLRGMAFHDAEVLIKTRKAKWVVGGQVPGGD